MCVCERERETDRQTDREKEAFQLGKQRAVRPCGRRPMEHAEEWEEGQCGWSLESERRLEVRPVARL